MIFSGELFGMVLAGSKRQTRRPVKRDENGAILPCRYAVGRTYAVQPKRGQPGQGRIRVLSIERVITHEISREDAHAEGFATPAQFMARWKELYGPSWPGSCWRIEFELVRS